MEVFLNLAFILRLLTSKLIILHSSKNFVYNSFSMTEEIIVKRLALIKYIYSVGIKQSQMHEANAWISILSFHDSIDMFMNLAAEKKGLKDMGSLMAHFKPIPELTLEASVKKINTRRNSLKHNFQLPAKIEIEDTRAITSQFFEENTTLIFGMNFNKISLVNIIKYPEIRDYLIKAEKYQQDGSLRKCVEEVAKAFKELKEIHREKIFKFPSHTYADNMELNYILPRLSKDGAFIDNPFANWDSFPFTKEKLLPMNDALFVLNNMYQQNFAFILDAISSLVLGVDRNQLIMFKKIVPEIIAELKGAPKEERYIIGEINSLELLTHEKTDFAINFVLEFSLKIQSL